MAYTLPIQAYLDKKKLKQDLENLKKYGNTIIRVRSLLSTTKFDKQWAEFRRRIKKDELKPQVKVQVSKDSLKKINAIKTQLNEAYTVDTKGVTTATRKVATAWEHNGKVILQAQDEITKKTKATGQTYEKVNRKFTTGLSQGVKGVKKLNGQLRETDDCFNHVSREGKTFVSQMSNITKKVVAFGAVTAGIGAVTTVISEAKDAVFEFDEALTEMKKVSEYSNEELQSYAETLGSLGETVARTRTEMVEASTEFIKSGYSEDDSATLSEVATMYQNIADSEMTAGESASFIISQMKAFNIDASESMSVIDKVNEVSNNFAVSSTDISTALTKTSSAMGALGNNMDETIGLVTSG